MLRETEVGEKPGAVRSFWERWKRVGKWIGEIQARLLLTLFYFVILAPFAVVLRWRGDPLAIKPGATRGWRPKGNETGSAIERATRQF
jgi:hypothetical protein